MSFDYKAPAGLFLSKVAKGSLKYRRFATAAEALRFAIEELHTHQTFDGLGTSSEIQRLYEAVDYPLRKSK
jgi:hypothetical protein